MKVLDRGRIHIAAVALGMCDRLIAMALGYAMERKQFGQRIAISSWCRRCWPT
jgi:acyl-CoA dehydrogenase